MARESQRASLAHRANDQRHIATPPITAAHQSEASLRSDKLDRDETLLFPIDAVAVEVFVHRFDG
jgi:hypothetical protein